MPFTRRDFVQTASVGAALGTLGEVTPALAADAQGSIGEATKIIDLDDRVTFKQQLERNIGPVVLMSTFLVPPEQTDAGLRLLERLRPAISGSPRGTRPMSLRCRESTCMGPADG